VRTPIVVLLLALSVAVNGCYRTTYVNLYPVGHHPAPDARGPTKASGWQSFWIFGWFPTEMDIDSRGICGDGNIQEIRTRRTFLQGLVAALASYYINIYSPWEGKTVCGPGTT